MVNDARSRRPGFEGLADVIIADLPCSGLGVIGKKQDIKYRITEEGLNELYSLQKKIINNVSKYVKKGGYLVYSTCTVNKKENEDLIEAFISNSGFSIVTSKKLLQGIDDSDGFFISVLKKN